MSWSLPQLGPWEPCCGTLERSRPQRKMRCLPTLPSRPPLRPSLRERWQIIGCDNHPHILNFQPKDGPEQRQAGKRGLEWQVGPPGKSESGMEICHRDRVESDSAMERKRPTEHGSR